MYKLLSIKYSAATHGGMHRDNNEDNLAILKVSENNFEFSDKLNLNEAEVNDFNVDPERLFYCTVADGIGGANAGELASEIAIKIFQDSISENKKASISNNDMGNFLRNTILLAHDKICEVSRDDPSKTGMGTTIVVASINLNGLCVAWSGDSRAYLWSPKPLKNRDQRLGLNQMELLTSDHSLVWEQVESGDISPEEARVHHLSHIINQNLGSIDTKPRPDIVFRKLNKGERILLCSDGLNSMLTEAQIEKTLSLHLPLSEIVNQFIFQANDAGGFDNISIILLEVMDVEEDSSSAGKSSHEFNTSTQVIKKSDSNKLLLNLSILAIASCIVFLLFFIYKETKNPSGAFLNNNSKMDSTGKEKEIIQVATGLSTKPSLDSTLVRKDSIAKLDSNVSVQKNIINNVTSKKNVRSEISTNPIPSKVIDSIIVDTNSQKNIDLKHKFPKILPTKKSKNK
ncbi:MAG: serine/threonine-protein phosphatase [Saprospiraceae bacterium]|nr:serine/threonine-protein phosphatase [Saprospiraceae bacterium]MBK9728133.1 serine/threonine-protein phosphatase [Saprospiraceae bacterium]